LDEKYLKNLYEPELFFEEFKEYYHLFDKNSFFGITEKRDKLDSIKKILQNFLNFYADRKFILLGNININKPIFIIFIIITSKIS